MTTTNYRHSFPRKTFTPDEAAHAINDRVIEIRTEWGYEGIVTPAEMGYEVKAYKAMSSVKKETAKFAYWAKLAAMAKADLGLLAEELEVARESLGFRPLAGFR